MSAQCRLNLQYRTYRCAAANRRFGPILLQKSGSKGVSAAPWIFEADARPLLSDSPRERLF